MKYTVTSDRLPWKKGATVDEADLGGHVLDELLAGGHLKKTSRKASK